jgi:hypothetical protein
MQGDRTGLAVDQPFNLDLQLGGICIPCIGVFRQALFHNSRRRLANFRSHLPQRRRDLVTMLVDHGHVRITVKWRPTRQQMEECGTQGIHIRPCTDGIPAALFACHGQRFRLLLESSQTEVGYLQQRAIRRGGWAGSSDRSLEVPSAGNCQQQIIWFDIAVNDSALMGYCHSADGVYEQCKGSRLVQGLLILQQLG